MNIAVNGAVGSRVDSKALIEHQTVKYSGDGMPRQDKKGNMSHHC